MSKNSQSLFDTGSMSWLQYATIFVCFLMNILDGADVLVMSYAATAIAKAWGTGPEALGFVFSTGLAGMTFGSLLLAPFADHIGRKKMILISALIMGIGMCMTAYTTTVFQLGILRFLSGIGIGSMLASTAALTAEYTSDKTKDFWVSTVIAGYPTGAVLSGLVAAKVIPNSGWEQMFLITGMASLITVPFIWFLLSESIDFYLNKQPANALAKANTILARMDRAALSALPVITEKKAAIPINKLLGSAYRIPTFQLWAALFFAFATLYFLTSWIPKLAESTGLSLELAIYAGTVFNVGAVLGIITQGYFSSRYGLKKTICTFLIMTAILMAIFQLFLDSDFILVVFGFIGFGLQGGFVGLYAVAARMYPTEFRTMGVGWAISAGRLGGVIGPAIGGILVGMGLAMATNFMIFAVPTLIAGIATLYISSKEIS